MMTSGTSDLTDLDFAAVSPEQFANLVRATPRAQLNTLLAGPARARVLDEVFDRMRTRFKPETAGRLSALVRWHIADAGAAERVYETDIRDGACAVRLCGPSADGESFADAASSVAGGPVADGAPAAPAASAGSASGDSAAPAESSAGVTLAADREPRLTLRLSAADFLRLASGNASGTTLFMTRRLKVTGDLSLAASLTRFFDIPKP